MTRPQHRKKIDRALENFQQISYTLSLKIKKALQNLDNFDGEPIECPHCHETMAIRFTVRELAEFARAVNQLISALKTLTELAPFFLAKTNIEGTQSLIDWLLLSTEIIGEQREQLIEIIKAYQLAIASDAAGILEREQYQLL